MSTQNSPESILIQAVACHTAGAFQDAERLYLAVLQTDPMHPVANHNLGAIAVQQSRPAEGLPYFLAALEADPASSRYWTSYIDALFQSGQVEEAGQMLSLAQQQGLQGAEVDALMLRINGPEQAATGDRPDAAEIDALVALFNGGHLVEATGIARKMTGRYPQHEFGWKALGAIYKQSGQDEAALVPMQKAAALSPGDVEAHYNLGVTLQALGRLVDAEAAYRHALSINPDYADAHCNLGVTLQKLGRFDDAYACYRRALQINPDFVAAHYNLGGVLRELGRTDEAQVSYRKVLELKPDYAEAHYNLGNILLDLSRLADAEACFREALRYKADYADAYFNLGKTLKEQGRLKESQASYIQSLQLCPDNAQAHYNLANVYKDMAQMDEAQSAYLQTIRIAPDMFEAHYNLGNLYLDMGRLVDAEACYRQAIRINPNLADAHYNLGNTLKEMGRVEEAATSFRRTLALRPDYAEAWCNLGNISLGVGRLFEAESIFRRAIQIKPDLSEAHCNLGNTLMALGCLDESHESYRRALQIKPDFSQAHSNLIFTLDLTAGCDSSLLHEERRLWAALHASHLHQQLMHPNLKDPLRRLRIGYVSADFRVHSAAYAFGAMLTRFDPANFDVIAYSNSTVEDELTRTFQRSVTAWRNIARLSDDEVSALIRSDDIDILVDLSGHSAGNRLLTFARKPAPVQITAWGYATGTGMAAMDVFFADPVFVPPHERHLYAEPVRWDSSSRKRCLR
jgi:protein O-GlcNAc transferase